MGVIRNPQDFLLMMGTEIFKIDALVDTFEHGEYYMNIVNIDVTIGEHYSHRHERAAVSIRQMFGFIENLQRREEQGAVGSLLVRGGAGAEGRRVDPRIYCLPEWPELRCQRGGGQPHYQCLQFILGLTQGLYNII